jgi:thermitase
MGIEVRRLAGILGLLAALAPAPAAAAAGDPAPTREIIVKRAPGLGAAERRELRAGAGARAAGDLRVPRTEIVRVPAGELGSALRTLGEDPDVVWAEPNVTVRALTADPYFRYQWGLENTGQDISGRSGDADADIDAPEAWLASTGAGETVGVVDTGTSLTHPDLVGQLASNPGESGNGRETNGIDDDGNGLVDDWRGWDFVAGDSIPQDQAGHGTHVTGTIVAAAGNAVGVAGVAYDARVLPIRALDANGEGTIAGIATALDYAGDLGLKVVNASLGGIGSSPLLRDVIAAHPGTLYVAAAGNDGLDVDTDPVVPCTVPSDNVICVGASTMHDGPAPFSNYGAAGVDLFAPGERVASTYLPAGYTFLNGTSMAAPHVAGVAALMRAANPALTTAQLRSLLMSSADRRPALAGLSVTGARLNAAAAVAAAQAPPQDPAPADPSPPPATGTAGDPSPATDPGPPPAGDPAPGPAAGPPPATAPVPVRAPTAPSLTALRLSGPAATRRRAVRVRYRLDRIANVTLVAQRRVCRVRAGRTRCAYRAAARRTVAGTPGANALAFTRRFGAATLKAGRYRLRVQATADGLRSTTATAAFRAR